MGTSFVFKTPVDSTTKSALALPHGIYSRFFSIGPKTLVDDGDGRLCDSDLDGGFNIIFIKTLEQQIVPMLKLGLINIYYYHILINGEL